MAKAIRQGFLKTVLATTVLLFFSHANANQTTPFDDPQEQVDLELVLAVDVSYSVDALEAETQREGYVAAIQHPSVIDAIQSGLHGKIALTYVEWADYDAQYQLVDWSIISDQQSANTFAQRLGEARRNHEFYTAIGNALDYCADLIEDNAINGLRRVIDISGDGPSNEGRDLVVTRNLVVSRGITINGLPILNDRPQPAGLPTPIDMALDDYFRKYVIGGPGSFVLPASTFDDFRSAVLRKLILEIAGLQPESEAIGPTKLGGRMLPLRPLSLDGEAPKN